MSENIDSINNKLPYKVKRNIVTLIGLCMLINVLDGFDITAMAVIASELATEMSISDDRLGFVFSFSLAGMMLGAMFLASFSDTYGRRKVILFSLLVVSVSVMLTGFADNLAVLIVLRFISGLGAGAMLASLAALVSEYSSKRYAALAVSLVTAGYPLGAMFTGMVSGVVVPEFGWRGMFFLGGGVTLLIFVVALFGLPESMKFLIIKGGQTQASTIEKLSKRYGIQVNELVKSDTVEDTFDKPRTIFQNIRSLLTEEYKIKTVTLWFSFLFIVCTLYFFLSWLPKLLVNEGFDVQFSRDAFTSFNFGGFLGIFLLGLISVRLPLYRVVVSFLLIAVVAMSLYSITRELESILLVLVFLIGALVQGGFTGLYALAAKLYRPKIRSTGIGWAIGLGRLGAVFGPAIAGFLLAGGMSAQAILFAFALPLIVGAIGIYTLKIE